MACGGRLGAHRRGRRPRVRARHEENCLLVAPAIRMSAAAAITPLAVRRPARCPPHAKADSRRVELHSLRRQARDTLRVARRDRARVSRGGEARVAGESGGRRIASGRSHGVPEPEPTACSRGALTIADREVLLHPPRDRARRRAVASKRSTSHDSRRGGSVPPIHFARKRCRFVAQSCCESSSRRRGRMADVVDEHTLVEHDVEVVHPDLETEIDVFAARDLVLLFPPPERRRGLASHHVDDARRAAPRTVRAPRSRCPAPLAP